MASDSDAGIGVGTPVAVTTGACPNIPETFLTLNRYWEYLQINECAARGIRNFPTTGVMGMGCGDYWDQRNRYWLAEAIKKVERRLETDRWLGFPLRRKYYGPRQLPYACQVNLGKYLRGIGVETNTVVEAGKNISLRTGGVIDDPVIFTVTVDFTDINELVIYYPGTLKCTIEPSEISISGTTVTISIPRCRLLKPEYYLDYKDDTDRPNYNVDANFLTQVDIYRNYLDTSTGSNLVWWRHQGALSCYTGVSLNSLSAPCSDVRQLACGYVHQQRFGSVQFEPATYSSGWVKSNYAVKRNPDGIETNFMKGYYDRYDEMDENLIRAVVAMAHNNLPQNYCSCDVQTLYWQRDTRALEPPVRLKSGQSTWGIFEAEQILKEFDRDRNSFLGGLL